VLFFGPIEWSSDQLKRNELSKQVEADIVARLVCLLVTGPIIIVYFPSWLKYDNFEPQLDFSFNATSSGEQK
jgi:hypothetical protein